jgi:chromosome partitioning protein
MIVTTFLNQKGGVGKTSSVYHLSAALAKLGRRVLLVDNDPQASLTQGFLGPDAMLAIPAEASVAALYEPDADPMPEAILRPAGVEGVWIAPGSIRLTRWNMISPESWASHQGGLRRFLDGLAGSFDLALIDCPPNLHLCSWAALVASGRIVVPVQPEDFGSQGLGPVHDSIAAVQGGPNPRLALAGYLLTMYDRRLSIHLGYEAMMREAYGADVFAAVVPLAKDFKEAVARRLPIGLYKPKGTAAKAAGAVALELLARVEPAAAHGERGAA